MKWPICDKELKKNFDAHAYWSMAVFPVYLISVIELVLDKVACPMRPISQKVGELITTNMRQLFSTDFNLRP